MTPSSPTSASSYAAIGAVIATDRVMEPFLQEGSMYSHGITFGGHPVQCAVALKNIEIMKREGLVERVRDNEAMFRAKLAKPPRPAHHRGHPRCGVLLGTRAGQGHGDEGRADDRGDPVLQISPPLVAGEAEMDEIVGILGDVLEEAGTRMSLSA